MGIRLRDDVFFEDPESRIREYCEIEVYEWYDDQHAENNVITKNDIDSSNKVYAMSTRYDKNEGNRIQSQSGKISPLLAEIPLDPIFTYSDEEWSSLITKIEKLLEKITAIHGVGIAKATKILYLKRPQLFPVLDNFVVQFHTKKSPSGSPRDISLALQCIEIARERIQNQIEEFTQLQTSVQDLPIPLTIVRMFDILCWTAFKWDIMRKTSAPRGTASRSLIGYEKPSKKKQSKVKPTTHKTRPKPTISSTATQEIIVDFFNELSERAKYGVRGEKPLAVLATLRYLIDTKQIGIKFLELLDYPYYEKLRRAFIQIAEQYGELEDPSNSWNVITGTSMELQRAIAVNIRVNQAVAGLITTEIEGVYGKLIQRYKP